jgi:predicted nucleic acid-binding protein
MRLLLDTNILIDLFDKQAPKGAVAERLTALEYFGDAELWVQAKSYTDIFYVLKRFMNPSTMRRGFLESLSIFRLCSLEKEDIEKACGLERSDFEDALIEVSAQKIGADFLVTRDKGFSCSTVPTLTPEQVFELFEQRGISYAAVDLQAL